MSDASSYYSSGNKAAATKTVTTPSIRRKKRKMIDTSVPLPKDFFPSSLDVVCGKGKEYYAHPGNAEFRQLVNNSLSQYARASTKHAKGAIVMAVVDAVRQQSPLGGFGRCEAKSSNSWY
jgi:hypothetical protein